MDVSINLKSLTYFVAAIEEGNITAAAKRCHISQPSISNAITILENHLNTQLFTRHKKGVTPTSEGYQLYNLSKKLLSDAAAIQATFSPRKTLETITLGLMTAIDIDRVLSLLAPILEKKGEYEIRLKHENDLCDARITCKGSLKEDETFHSLWKERFVLALPTGHPLSVKPQILINDLVGLPLIAREYCSVDMLSLASQHGIDLNIVATAFSEDWAVALVNSGVGAAVVPETYISPNDKIIVRHFENLEVVREVGMAFSSKKPVLKAIEMILQRNTLSNI